MSEVDMDEGHEVDPVFPITIVESDGTERQLTGDDAKSFWDAVQATSDYLTSRDGAKAWKDAVAELNRTVPGLELDRLGGYVPIQGEGTYEGESCYFRARGQHASFSVGTYHPDGMVTNWLAKRKATAQVVPDDDPFGAGYLTPAECVVIIREVLVPNLQEMSQEEGEAELQNFHDLVDKMVTRMNEKDAKKEAKDGEGEQASS